MCVCVCNHIFRSFVKWNEENWTDLWFSVQFNQKISWNEINRPITHVSITRLIHTGSCINPTYRFFLLCVLLLFRLRSLRLRFGIGRWGQKWCVTTNIYNNCCGLDTVFPLSHYCYTHTALFIYTVLTWVKHEKQIRKRANFTGENLASNKIRVVCYSNEKKFSNQKHFFDTIDKGNDIKALYSSRK